MGPCIKYITKSSVSDMYWIPFFAPLEILLKNAQHRRTTLPGVTCPLEIL